MNTGKYTLVTGGAGFIGSALVHALNKSGNNNIVVADILGMDEKFKNLIPLRYADYIEADDLIELAEEEPDYFDQFETIFHLGACSATTERDASYLIRNNYEYTKTLASIAIDKGIRFVYASSAATYGDGSKGMDDTLEDLHALNPLNMYGYSKHMFDCYAQRMAWDNKIVGLKYYNVFGPNERHKDDMRSLVAKSYEQIQATGEIGLFKSYHPEYTDGNRQGRRLTVPNTFDITYMYQGQENQFLHKISTCVLESMDVTYGGDRYKTYENIPGDGSPPTETTIALKFREMEIITRDRIVEGF